MKISFFFQTLAHMIVRIIFIPFLLIRYKFKLSYKINFFDYPDGMFLSNHQSLIDPPIVGIFTPKTLHFLAKKPLFKNFIFGKILKIVGAIPINRRIFDTKIMNTIVQILEYNHSVLVFPEGTRSKSNKLLKGKGGVGYLIDKSDNPSLTPVRLYNTRKAEKSLFSFKRPEVKVIFGRPFCINKNYNWGEKNSEKYRKISAHVMTVIGDLS